MPNVSSWFQLGVPYNVVFPSQYFVLNKEICFKWVDEFLPEWFLLDTYYWNNEEFEEKLILKSINFKKFADDLYRLTYPLEEIKNISKN